MNNFILNLVRRGAGYQPMVSAQPTFTPTFAPGLRVEQTSESETPRGDDAKTGSQGFSEVISTEPSNIQMQVPRQTVEPTPQAQAEIAATRKQEPQSSEPDALRPLLVQYTSESSSQPQAQITIKQPSKPYESTSLGPKPETDESLRQASTPLLKRSGLPAQERQPLSSASESKVSAVAIQPAASDKPTTRIKARSNPEAPVGEQHSSSLLDAASPGRTSAPAATLVSKPGSSNSADRSQSVLDAFIMSQPLPRAVPGVMQLPPLRNSLNPPPTPNVAEPGSVAPSPARPIEVRIGTIDVRAVTPPAARPAVHQQRRRPGGFDDYSMIRCYTRWERE